MWRHVDTHIQVSWRSTADAGIAFSLYPDPLSIRDTLGDANTHGLRTILLPDACAPLTGSRPLFARAATRCAAPREDHVAAHRADGTIPLTDLTGPGTHPRLTGARTGATGLPPGHCDRSIHTAEGLLERELKFLVQVGAAFVRHTLASALAQPFREEITERRRVVGAAGGKIEPFKPALRPCLAWLEPLTRVVARSTLRIDQRLVGVQDLPEPRLRDAIARIDVRVKPARKTTVGALDVGLRRAMRQSQDDVQIHSYFFSSSTTSASITSPCAAPPGADPAPASPGSGPADGVEPVCL